MGQIFGRTGVAEPAYEVLYQRSSDFTYEIRKYGTRFAAHTSYNGTDDSPFRLLARYIGVFGTPENEGQQPISMTAPVIVEDKTKPVAIAMTAPVMIQPQQTSEQKSMEFVLPAEYDSIDKIPKPTNPAVIIKELPASVGAVHRFSGSMSESTGEKMASQLGEQLHQDGINSITPESAIQQYQFWGYNPPFTLPPFRRNEVWIALDDAQVEQLLQSVGGSEALPKN